MLDVHGARFCAVGEELRAVVLVEVAVEQCQHVHGERELCVGGMCHLLFNCNRVCYVLRKCSCFDYGFGRLFMSIVIIGALGKFGWCVVECVLECMFDVVFVICMLEQFEGLGGEVRYGDFDDFVLLVFVFVGGECMLLISIDVVGVCL